MNDNICPKAEKCPLFNGFIIANESSQKIYKRLYCNNGIMGRMECKRYLVSESYGKPDITLLPNDPRSLDEIIEEMKNKDL
jgi:hypothetical protein